MSKATWTLTDKGKPTERWTATLNGHALEVWEDEEQVDEDEECWGWQVTRPDGSVEMGDSTSEDGAKETAESYTLPDETPAPKVYEPRPCPGGCGAMLTERDAEWGLCPKCWNKQYI